MPPARNQSRSTPESSPSRVWVQNPARAGLVGWLLRYYVFAGLALLVALGGVGIAVYRYFAQDLPDLAAIERYHTTAPGVTRIYAADGALLAELAREHRAYVEYEDIPEPIIQAFLAAEDRRFFEHGGLDYRGLARATLANLRSGTVIQGGSTITQQVAKGFLSDDRTIARKLREAILSVRMESRLGKDRILEIYLNKIFLGHNAYGVAAAANRYFDKKLSELTLGEAGLIAGLARAPSRYSPVAHIERAEKRRAVVLQDMVEAGYIDAEARDAANAEPIELAHTPDVFRLRAPHYAEEARGHVTKVLGEDVVLQEGLRIETPVELELQAHARDAVDVALRRLDRRQGWRGPVANLAREDARTTLIERLTGEYGEAALSDPKRFYLGLVQSMTRYEVRVSLGSVQAKLPLRNMQWASRYDRNSGVNSLTIDSASKALEVGDVIWVHLDERGTKHAAEAPGYDGIPLVKLTQTPHVEGALYTVEHDTGYVVAMQGGHDYDRSQYCRPTQACRQPGSVFKAVYYAYALDSGGYDMGSILEDKPYEPEPGEEWNPQNIHGTIDGKVLLRTAFIRSLNLPSIRLFQRLGADRVVEFARQVGFTTELIADKALSLGASCVKIDELTRAFGVFVRGGTTFQPRYIRRVTDKHGRVLMDERSPLDGAMDVAGRLNRMATLGVRPPVQAVDPRTAFLITRLMREVVTSGIGARAQRIGVPAGGKTGTASKGPDTSDTWFVGFTSRYVTAAWIGDDNYQRSLGDEEASYTTAAPMWTDFMKEVVKDIPHRKLPLHRPPGLVTHHVDARTGGEPIDGLPQATLYLKEG
jgi:penicillin-binding protein 1A